MVFKRIEWVIIRSQIFDAEDVRLIPLESSTMLELWESEVSATFMPLIDNYKD